MLVLLRLIFLGSVAVVSGSNWWNQWKAVRGIELINREVFSLRGRAALRIANDPSATGINAIAAAAAGEYGQ